MANKEPKSITRFPKRLLSSFRRGKKLNTQAGNNDHTGPTAETTGFTQGDLETAQHENAIIDHEATLMLDSPRKKDPMESHSIDVESPKRNLRRVLDEDHNNVFDTTPRAQRFKLGGPMSASADSGIDCSILLSEKSSPEQFLAFTRREAERLRQEHLHNGSVLETLDEVDRSTVEGTDNMTEEADTTNELVLGDTENLNEVSTDADNKVLAYTKNYSQSEGAVGNCEKGATIPTLSDSTCDTLPVPSACGDSKTAKVTSCKETKDYFSSSGGDYVLLTENCDVRAPLVDATLYISSNKTCSVSKPEAHTRDSGCVNEPIDRVDDDSRLENVLVPENVTNVKLTENKGDNSYLNVYANRTDEIKSAEARLRQIEDCSPEVELNLALTYDIVNPIPVSSACIATHRVIPSTPSPARLYINENSAFAKCKSLKRSVSDVGKGILGRLRHRSKDGAEYDCRSGKVQETYKKKSGLTKIKKFGVKKEKLGRKVKLYEENDKSMVRHKGEQAAWSSKEENNAIVSLNNSFSTKSPVLKELVFEQEKLEHEKSKGDFVAKQSPFYKEILSESVKLELEASFQEQHSPVMTESVRDITAGISEMTTALCASSAESIACICDCKKMYSNPECCEKKKTPSPLLSNECIEKNFTPSNVHNASKRNSHFELYVALSQTKDQENLESQQCDINQVYTIENETDEYSPLLCKNTSVFQIHENQHGQSQNSVGGVEHDVCGDESSDENYSNYYEDDNDTTSSDECSDLDCSNCCIASPNTGVVDFSSSSSDSECSFSGSHENSVLDNKDLNRKRNTESSSESSWSSQNPELVSCSSCSERSSSSPQEECSFNIEGSPYSVSFKEIDFENGDVMYLANNLNDELEKSWINDSRDSEKLSAVCATPVSSPRVCDDLSFESSPLTVNHSDSIVSDSSQNQSLEEEISDCSMPGPASWSEANRSILGKEKSPSQSLLVPPNAEQTQDSSFSNVSFDGSFADASFSVHEHRTCSFSRQSSCTNSYSSVLDEQEDSERNYSSCSQLKLLNSSQSLNQTLYDVNDSSFIDSSVRSLSHLNDSRLLQRTLRQNHNLRVNSNNSIMLEKSGQNVNHSFSTFESNCLRDSAFYCYASGNSLNRSWSGNHMKNFSVGMIDSRNTSLYETSPSSSPLNLSLNKGKRTGSESCVSKKPNREWVNRHLGQVYSPAKRVLQKNRGLSETDLCKQILDLYVSDADESGFELADNEISLNSSSICSTGNTSLCGDMSGTNLDDTGSDEEKLPMQYGTYVAPRNVVKETDVDDFTTTTVWTCYTGEAKTRKLPGNSGSLLQAEVEDRQRGDDRQRTDLDELPSMSVDKRSSKKRSSGTGSFCPSEQLKDDTSARRVALRDQTNTTGRLSSSETSVPSEKSFDRLTQLHTVHNGQRKVRCLSMDESQNVVKYYPPPKEATRVSWGQTISEMDLYRHTPRKTPVKTRPILNQKENNYPYGDDTPSPIVLTKMRKPKSLAKKYKNWPWS